MNNEIRDLLEEIQDWMLENDYESGTWGHEIYKRVKEILGTDE